MTMRFYKAPVCLDRLLPYRHTRTLLRTVEPSDLYLFFYHGFKALLFTNSIFSTNKGRLKSKAYRLSDP